MTALLEVEDASKIYRLPGWRAGEVRAVDRVSLSVPRGSVLGVVGESGCGKSTLAKLILRLEKPSSGRIRFDGTEIGHLSGAALRPLRQRMQMVFQDPTASLNPRKRVARVLDESLRLAGTPDRAQAASMLLERVGLGPDLLGRYPHELSGGQKQRVAIARALAMGPELLVADEPVSALDVSLQAQVVRLLMRLREELSLTLIFISHDLALVHHLCDDMIVMQAGRVVEHGHPANVLHNPAHAYTRLLLDAVPRGRERALQGQSS